MAKAHRFKSANGGARTINAFSLSAPIYIPADGVYTTDDPAELEVLEASVDVAEVKVPKGEKDG